jgi:prophage regulatory protein
MRLLTFTELKQQKGIPYCRDHLRRKVNAGEFPKPIDFGPGRIAWIEEEVDAYLEGLTAKRDQQSAVVSSSGAKPQQPRTIKRPRSTAQPRQQHRSRRSS